MSWSASTFPMRPLGELARIQAGYAFESARFTESSTDVPLVKGENVQQGYVDWSIAKRWPEAEMHALEQFLLKPGDIVVAMDRPWVEAGLKWAYIKPEDPPSLLVQRVARLRAGPELDQTYLRAVISSSYFSAYIQPIVTGVNVPHISGRQIANFKVPVLPMDQQRKVAALISAYDDLIANNQRRIALLQSMAEEIYREWFVRMRLPASDEHASLTRTDLTPLEELGTFLNGYPFEPTELHEEGMPIIKIKELNAGVSPGTPRNTGEKIPDKYKFGDGDIVFSWSGSLIVQIWHQGPALLNQHLFKVTPAKGISREFLYFSIKFAIPIFESLTTGATMQHIKRKELRFVKVRVPGPRVMAAFDNLVSPLMDQALRLEQISIVLKAQRDALLPRLISGKLRVDALDIQFPPSMQPPPAQAAQHVPRSR